MLLKHAMASLREPPVDLPSSSPCQTAGMVCAPQADEQRHSYSWASWSTDAFTCTWYCL